MALHRFSAENVRAKEKTIWTPVSLGGFYLALRHVQRRLLELSHLIAARGRFWGDSCYSPTYFGHRMSQALDFTAGSCLAHPWSWGSHFPCLGEVAPVGPCRRQSPSAPPERRVENESRVFAGIPFRECGQGLGGSCGSWIGDHKVLVCLWGELHPLHMTLGDLFTSMLQFCCKRGKSKNLRWEPVTARADGQMCLSYISVLSTTEIIKTAE